MLGYGAVGTLEPYSQNQGKQGTGLLKYLNEIYNL